MSVPAADRLRPALVRYCRTPEEHMSYCGRACTWHYEMLTHEDVATAADLLDAIEVLHQPRVIVYRPNDDHDIICRECDKPWPCETHRLLHPEEARRG